MFIFIREKELERNPDNMKGRELLEARFAIFSGIYPDFYGWRYYYFVLFLIFIHPGLYCYFLYAYGISFYYGMLYADVELLGQVLCLGTITVIYCIVSIYYIARKTDMDDLITMVGKGFLNYSRGLTEQEKTIIDRMEKVTHRYAFGSTAMLMAISLVHMGLLPMIRGLKGQFTSITNETAPINKFTPLPVWMPFECNSTRSFVLTFIWQIIPGCMEYAIINACCILYVGLAQQLSGNLEILANSIRDIHTRALIMFENDGGILSKITGELYENSHFLKCINACLNENIEHHVKLIEFFNKFQGVAGFSMLAIFSGTGLIISTAAYSLLLIAQTGGDSELLITNAFVWTFYLFVYTFLLTVYCYYGQEVTDKNDALLPALYETPWLEADLPFRRSLLISMSYSQRTMELSAFGLIQSSYATLLDIIKTAFSYLNMLMAVQ
uniref:Odorant receptor n=1 Tax=Adelphocoris lineolatus TaxID=236346 RepID=A0A2I4PHM2_ADELI|nr:olfactory receptor 64 [Adelphocoris lineolatus]QQL94662.1 olfactory receptor 6 [Adelphocoris lineolatus]